MPSDARQATPLDQEGKRWQKRKGMRLKKQTTHQSNFSINFQPTAQQSESAAQLARTHRDTQERQIGKCS